MTEENRTIAIWLYGILEAYPRDFKQVIKNQDNDTLAFLYKLLMIKHSDESNKELRMNKWGANWVRQVMQERNILAA